MTNMLFCSEKFVLFFVVVFTIYWAIPWHRIRLLFLLATGFYFYANWNPMLAALIAASSALDYLLARGIESQHFEARRRGLMLLSVVANLSLLCYFKYANFFLASLEQWLTS